MAAWVAAAFARRHRPSARHGGGLLRTLVPVAAAGCGGSQPGTLARPQPRGAGPCTLRLRAGVAETRQQASPLHACLGRAPAAVSASQLVAGALARPGWESPKLGRARNRPRCRPRVCQCPPASAARQGQGLVQHWPLARMFAEAPGRALVARNAGAASKQRAGQSAAAADRFVDRRPCAFGLVAAATSRIPAMLSRSARIASRAVAVSLRIGSLSGQQLGSGLLRLAAGTRRRGPSQSTAPLFGAGPPATPVPRATRGARQKHGTQTSAGAVRGAGCRASSAR